MKRMATKINSSRIRTLTPRRCSPRLRCQSTTSLLGNYSAVCKSKNVLKYPENTKPTCLSSVIDIIAQQLQPLSTVWYTFRSCGLHQQQRQDTTPKLNRPSWQTPTIGITSDLINYCQKSLCMKRQERNKPCPIYHLQPGPHVAQAMERRPHIPLKRKKSKMLNVEITKVSNDPLANVSTEDTVFESNIHDIRGRQGSSSGLVTIYLENMSTCMHHCSLFGKHMSLWGLFPIVWEVWVLAWTTCNLSGKHESSNGFWPIYLANTSPQKDYLRSLVASRRARMEYLRSFVVIKIHCM